MLTAHDRRTAPETSTPSCSRRQCRSVHWLQPRTTQSAFASTASASPPPESASVQPDSFTASSQQPTRHHPAD